MKSSTMPLNMRKWLSRQVTIDDVALYLARGAFIHPLLDETYLELLVELQRLNKVSLLPMVVLQLFHRKIRKVA